MTSIVRMEFIESKKGYSITEYAIKLGVWKI